MLNDLDETIKYLLVDGVPLDLSEVDVAFEPPNQEWSGSLARPTINCYLYHLVENRELRHTDWELDRSEPLRQRGNGETLSHTMMRRRMPFRVDCHYVLSAWANNPEDEHRLLWRMMAALMRYQQIPDEMLKGDLANEEWPIHTKVAQPEGVIKNPSDFWSGMEAPIKPTINYVATLPLDPSLEWELPIVITRRVKMYPGIGNVTGFELPPVQFGGWALVKGGDGRLTAVPDAQVLIVEKGISTTTNDLGRFRFDALPHGQYTLRATAEEGVAERKIELPGEEYDLVLTARKPGEAAIGEPDGSSQSGKNRRR